MNKHSHFTIGNKPFLSIGGQARNSSSFTKVDAEYACRSVIALEGNTIAFPVSWETFEPDEGDFDPTLVLSLIDLARSYKLRLIVLWFASWKNGTMEYCPNWVKTNPNRFPRVLMPGGEDTFVVSPYAHSTCAADAKAFSSLMSVIKEYDETEHTVIAVQVENEAGIYAPVKRDFSPFGQREFQEQIPSVIVDAAKNDPQSKLGQQWSRCGSKTQGSWLDVLGAEGPEACTAWHIATFVNKVTEAGKREYDLPMYTNAWVEIGNWGIGGLDYPCGGPINATPALDIWRCAASALDFISPDLYTSDFASYSEIASDYARPDSGWPLYIPESFYSNPNPSFMFHAIGDLGAIGNHVFAVEDMVDADGIPYPEVQPFVRSHRMLREAQELILFHQGKETMHTLVQRPGQVHETVPVRGWLCYCAYEGPDFRWNGTDYRHMDDLRHEFDPYTDIREEGGRAFIFQTNENEFLMIGHQVRIFLAGIGNPDGSVSQIMMSPIHMAANMPTQSVDEGHMEQGRFVVDRPRTGDESRHGIWLSADCGLVRVRMASKAGESE